MSIENNKITGSQFLFTVACFMQSSALLTAFYVSVTKQDSWISTLFAIILFMPFILVLAAIIKRFPDKNLIQINEYVFGKVLGKIISTGYVLFFVTLATLNLRELGFFVQMSIMHSTPLAAIIIMFMIVVSFAVKYGVDVTTRYNTLFSIVSMFVVTLSTTLIFSEINFSNYLPMFDLPFKTYVQGIHILATIPFGEMIIFLMITPCVKAESSKLTRLLFWGTLIGAINILIVVVRDSGVLGNLLPRFSMPAFETLRLISIAQTLSRMEIMFATVLIILLFSKITILFYAAVLAIAQIFNMKTYRPLIISLAVIVIIYTLTMYSYSPAVQHNKSGMETIPFIWLIFEFILPLITCAVMFMRNAKSEKGEINIKNAKEQKQSRRSQQYDDSGGAQKTDQAQPDSVAHPEAENSGILKERQNPHPGA